jgi:RND family efflux transporter MFP subunit
MRPAILTLLVLLPVSAAPPEVPVVKPVEREVLDHEDVTGRTEAGTTVEIRSRLTGYLDKVVFKEGSAVKKGDVLFQLDDRLQRAEVAKAEAEYKRTDARLKGAELDVSRVTKLGDARAISREEVEKAAAAVEEAKANLLVARAGQDVAKLNLDFTRITSPVDGRIGRANATAGNLVRDADLLATVYGLDPLHLTFDLDERTLLRLVRHTRGQGEAKVMVGVALTGDEGFPRKADVDFLDPVVDPKTGTVRVRPVLPNPKEEVRPGQFARVRLPDGEVRKANFLPTTAFGRFTAGGQFVLFVNSKGVLEYRTVRVGRTDSGLVEVTDGLKPGEWVVREVEGRHVGEDVRAKPVSDPPAKGPKRDGPGVNAAPPRPLPDFPGAGPAIVVSAAYPGANARVVEESVAGPIDAQITGLEKMTHRVLACSDDGTMRFTLLFEKGTELHKAQVLAQQRVALAERAIPDAVRRQGVTIRKRGVHLAAVALVSPTDRYDRTFLANYAKLQLRDELARVPGVADATFWGDPEAGPRVRLFLDPDKLAARGLAVRDVAAALKDIGVATEAAPTATPDFVIRGRVARAEGLDSVTVKATPDGQAVHLRDVARVELMAGPEAATGLDGKPAAFLLVTRLPDADTKVTAKALRDRVADLARRLPEGMEVKVVGEEP